MSNFFGVAAERPRELEAERAIDAVADAAGFVSREAMKPIPRRKLGTRAQLHNFTMRLAVDDMEYFIAYCDRHRLKYREAFADLMTKLKAEEGRA